MYRLAKSSNNFIDIFITLCLCQVKEQLNENLVYLYTNPPSFTCNGDLFTYMDNELLLLEEANNEDGYNLDFQRLN
ncbi:MAG: hypothetical protein WKI04_20230 [Ferruginibacter sp.]